MFKFSAIALLIFISYYFNRYQSFIFTVDDDITNHFPKMIEEPYEPNIPSDDDHLSLTVTEYYKDLNTYIIPTEKILPLQVFYDHDVTSFSKPLYECVEHYHFHNNEIMKNTKHLKIIVINTNEKSYCIMNTDLLI